jgi:DNA polymerase III delta subunit
MKNARRFFMEEKPKLKMIWLGGSYLRRREMLAKVQERFNDAERIVCNGDMTFEFFMSEIETSSCFGEKRLIIIHDMPIFDPSSAKAKNLTAFKDTLAKLADNTFVVFNGVDKDKFKTIYAQVGSLGKCYDFEETLDMNVAPDWLVDLFSKLGYKISKEAAEFMVERCGWDKSLDGVGRDLLELTARGLCLFAGKQKEITIDHIVTSAFENENLIIWSLLDALDDKNYDECLKIMGKMIQSEGSALKAVNSIFPMLIWRYRMLFFLKENLLKGDSNHAMQAALQMRKLSQSGTGEFMKMTADLVKTGENKGQFSPAWTTFVLGRVLNSYGSKPAAIECYSRKELFRVIQILEEGLYTIRSSSNDAISGLVADVFFMAVCNTLDDKSVRKLRASLCEVM